MLTYDRTNDMNIKKQIYQNKTNKIKYAMLA